MKLINEIKETNPTSMKAYYKQILVQKKCKDISRSLSLIINKVNKNGPSATKLYNSTYLKVLRRIRKMGKGRKLTTLDLSPFTENSKVN